MNETSTQEGGREIRRGLQAGFVSGLAAITCCVSPVVLVLLGVATAAEAVTLGDTLYYEYGWFFRAGGLVIGGRRGHTLPARAAGPARSGERIRTAGCSLRWFATGAATYAGLFWFTKYLGIWFG